MSIRWLPSRDEQHVFFMIERFLFRQQQCLFSLGFHVMDQNKAAYDWEMEERSSEVLKNLKSVAGDLTYPFYCDNPNEI